MQHVEIEHFGRYLAHRLLADEKKQLAQRERAAVPPLIFEVRVLKIVQQ